MFIYINNNNFNSLATINSEDNDKNNEEDSSKLLSGSPRNNYQSCIVIQN